MASCKICKKSYVSEYNLQRHMKNIHGTEDTDDNSLIDSESDENESDDDESVDTKWENGIIGDVLKEIVGDFNNETAESGEEGEEEEDQLSSIEELTNDDNYKNILDAFKAKVIILYFNT